MLLSAPTKSGKTYFLQRYIEEYGHYYDHILIVSPSTEFNRDYQDLRRNQEKVRFLTPDKQVVNTIYNAQRKASLRAKEHPNEFIVPHTFIIFDDVIDSGLMNFRGICDKYAERGRHLNLTAAFCTQRLSASSRSIRINARLFIFFKPFAVSETESFVERMVPRHVRKEFLKFLHEVVFSEKYQFLLYDQRDNANQFYYGKTEDFIQGTMQHIDFLQQSWKTAVAGGDDDDDGDDSDFS
jgi:hypothetical protein